MFTEEVEYTVVFDLMQTVSLTNIDESNAEKISPQTKVEFERFGVRFSSQAFGSLNGCLIRGQHKGKTTASTLLNLYFGDDDLWPETDRMTKIIPVSKESNSIKFELLRHLEKVNWTTVAKEFRDDFKTFWTTGEITDAEKNSITETCKNHNPFTTQQMMTCIGKLVADLQSSKIKQQNKEVFKKAEQNKNIYQPKVEQSLESGNEAKLGTEDEKTTKPSSESENQSTKLGEKDEKANQEQSAESENVAKRGEENEKSMWDNPYFTVPLTLTLGVMCFFVLLYIRNVYFLSGDEFEEESEYDTYDFV